MDLLMFQSGTPRYEVGAIRCHVPGLQGTLGDDSDELMKEELGSTATKAYMYWGPSPSFLGRRLGIPGRDPTTECFEFFKIVQR